MNLTETDQQLLEHKGISKAKVLDQIDTFRDGIPFVNLESAAIVGEGILKFSSEEENALIQNFEANRQSKSLLKFVPASGAASRMFKALFNFLDNYNWSEETIEDYIKRTGDNDIQKFSEGLEDLPFYNLVKNRIGNLSSSIGEELYSFVNEMMSEKGLNYGFFPKGLLPFHKYESHAATPFEEHLKESVAYASANGLAKLHFTISEQHDAMFASEYENSNEKIASASGIKFNVDYSNQKPATDTIAVDLDNKPFRNDDGSLLFRPGGHGALIENLNDQDADIIFIKNIDNVAVSKYGDEIAESKKILAGHLLKVQEKAFDFAKKIDDDKVSGSDMVAIKQFIEKELNACFLDSYEGFSLSEQLQVLKDKLNRPIRVCGMVKNEGEPGGGPFWILDAKEHKSLQIIESAQIDMSDSKQVAILKNATHFNPVDLVCGVRNYKGEKFNLLNYVDSKQGFIAQKTKDGKDLKALELPGLWNGAMAFWNTIFVEVPLITFNPVKTVNDLLKPAHQVK
ncbi:DUF4301 family protein [Aurantibacter crassamenti]|uniref:DUF4301 family protein n=1 Tax=Aurantibacter crassamenti TaxID=1837375 RepID=UPI00193A16C0|nr:DUF4301 family protein [Aurantibacter crassamenti]MBM1104834.1 DUF4301 family protein [Aurantibacter crassamenti]